RAAAGSRPPCARCAAGSAGSRSPSLRDALPISLGAGGIIWGKLGAVLAVLVVQVALLLTTAAILGLDASVVNITGTAFALLSGRSEEHTSELQSRENLVCRLLLEKQKKPQQGPA